MYACHYGNSLLWPIRPRELKSIQGFKKIHRKLGEELTTVKLCTIKCGQLTDVQTEGQIGANLNAP